MTRSSPTWISGLACGLLALHGCASTQVADSAGGEELTGSSAEGDEQLDGDDFLVQVKSNEYRVGKLTTRGPVRGIMAFTLVNGDEIKSAAYHVTVAARAESLYDGTTACFFKEKEKDEVFQKPASKDEARSGLWNCRAVRDVTERAKGHILVGEVKVAVDNLRVEKKESSGGID